MPIENVLSGVTSSARNPVGTGLTGYENGRKKLDCQMCRPDPFIPLDSIEKGFRKV